MKMGQSCCVRIEVNKAFTTPNSQVSSKDSSRSRGVDGLVVIGDGKRGANGEQYLPLDNPRPPPAPMGDDPPAPPSPAVLDHPLAPKSSPRINANNGDLVLKDVDEMKSYFDLDVAELQTLPTDPESTKQRTDKLVTFMTGATYKGQWKGNARHGFGIQHWPDGGRYEGEWVHNQATGLGKSFHVDGSSYIGQWKDSMAHGNGIFYKKQPPSIHAGQWFRDHMHGIGFEEWHEHEGDGGCKYQGQYFNGKRQGFGVYHWPDGSVYEGDWLNNSMNGYGSFIGKDGHRCNGQWKDTVIQGTGQTSSPDGTVYSGKFINHKKHGFGVLTLADGKQVKGWWKEGQLCK